MSKFYEMQVEIKDYDLELETEIQAAVERQWVFDETWTTYAASGNNLALMTNLGQGYLVGGETEREFSLRFAKTIWQINQGYCYVEVRATCLDDIPYDVHVLTEMDYCNLAPLGDCAPCSVEG